MGKQNRSINGGTLAEQIAGAPPVIPVKSEQQLLLELELERVKKENEKLKARPATGLSMKVSEKGALSVYGLMRFPVTLYVEQWLRLLGASDEIRAFIQAHDSQLSRKLMPDGYPKALTFSQKS